jgi:hypothetical protein
MGRSVKANEFDCLIKFKLRERERERDKDWEKIVFYFEILIS